MKEKPNQPMYNAISNLPATEILKLTDCDREIPYLNKIWIPLMGVSMGIVTGVGVNWATRRPLFSGIQKHIIAVGAYTVLFDYINEKRKLYLAKRDAVFMHYITLHPDDFKPPTEVEYKGEPKVTALEREKIGDIIESWVPVR